MRIFLPPRRIETFWLSGLHRHLRSPIQARARSYGISVPLRSSAVDIGNRTIELDDWNNVPPNILALLSRQLHLLPDHPIAITRRIIESLFPQPTYTYYNDLSPIVSTKQNFDSLGFPKNHPGRRPTDTYYFNKDTVLRTHTSAHEVDTFRDNKSGGYLISADCYRRDAIDRSHYPAFHQMEGARMWDRSMAEGGNITKLVLEDLDRLPKNDLQVEDPNPTTHPKRNPLQSEHHTQEEVDAVAKHLKRSIENVVASIFAHAKAGSTNPQENDSPLRVRWIEAFFPFTSPSWELEVFWEGDWLELLGCGIVKQQTLVNANVPTQMGWAFGIGLERVAMLLFKIADIRLFWSQDERFLSQFSASKPPRPFIPFSKHPACYKDVAFWLKSSSSSAGGGNSRDFHENDIMEIVREIAGNDVEDVKLVDEFSHPSTGRRSLCYRVNYRSLDKTLTNTEANALHTAVTERLQRDHQIELR